LKRTHPPIVTSGANDAQLLLNETTWPIQSPQKGFVDRIAMLVKSTDVLGEMRARLFFFWQVAL
jgi:hypothetical protein